MSVALLFSVLAVFLAAVVRGFSGFGFSLLAVSALTLFYAPAEVVPAVFLLEVAASLHLLPSIWKDIHWRSLLPLIIGCLVATPVGAYLLANIPAGPMQIALSVFVLFPWPYCGAGLCCRGFLGLLHLLLSELRQGCSTARLALGGRRLWCSILLLLLALRQGGRR